MNEQVSMTDCGKFRQGAADRGKYSYTAGITSPFSRRRNSLRPASFGQNRLRPPEPKVAGSNPAGDAYKKVAARCASMSVNQLWHSRLRFQL